MQRTISKQPVGRSYGLTYKRVYCRNNYIVKFHDVVKVLRGLIVWLCLKLEMLPRLLLEAAVAVHAPVVLLLLLLLLLLLMLLMQVMQAPLLMLQLTLHSQWHL
jgi:hypothetical protein